MRFFNLVDLIYGPLVLIFIIVLTRSKKYSLVKKFPEYKYYTKGMYVKLAGGLALCMIYTMYYGGGDTIGYFQDSMIMVRLLFKNPSGFFSVMINGLDMESYWAYFDYNIGYPMYYRDPMTFMVVRFTTVLTLLAAGSYVVTTLLFAWFSYGGVWRLYKVFVAEFPDLKKEMAIAVLFIPSVFFWSSGVLKDTITMSAIGYYTYAFYQIFIVRDKIIGNLFTMFLSVFLIMSIKPYIAFALLPGSLIWLVNKFIFSLKNQVVKNMIGPFMLIIAIGGGYLILNSLKGLLGIYSVDQVLERAVISNQDLKADYYGGNSFDIGDFDPTVSSMLSKAPAAINAAIFRPYLWESRNIVMLVSGLESMMLLFLTFRFFIQVRILGFLKYLTRSHLLAFSLIFSLFFAFSVGISTSNFGSLVRYRIPVLPFYVASLFIMQYYYKRDRKSDSLSEQEELEYKFGKTSDQVNPDDNSLTIFEAK